MAEKDKTKLSSWNDFSEENLLNPEVETPEVEEQETEEIVEKAKDTKKKLVKKVKEEEVEEEQPEVVTKKVVTKVQEKIKAKEEELEETEIETPAEEEEVEEQEEVDPAQIAIKFFDEVQKITGQEIEVDYGKVDPLSPQGVALREAAVKETALDTFLAEIEEKFPVVYRALVHANNGGDVAELFTQTTGRDYSKIELKEGDEAISKEILKEYYKSKGVKSDTKLAQLIETDEDSANGLVGEAKAALDELKAEQLERQDKVFKAQQQKDAEDKKRDGVLIAAVDDVLESKQLGSFKISDRAEAGQFRKFVLSNVRKTGDGKYELATQLDQANLAKVLQYQYFQFKGGDLSKIIQQKADTTNAERLSLRLKGEQQKAKKTTEQEDRGQKRLTLRDYEV